MKRRIRTLISMISFSLTLFLLISVMFSWYVVNKTATVTGGTGSVKGKHKIYMSAVYTPSDEENPEFALSELSSKGFDQYIRIRDISNYLTPVSSPDGNDFYYASEINSDGTAVVNATGDSYEKVGTLVKDYYYVERVIYLCTTETEDATAYISSLSISCGTSGGSVYKAVRIAMVSDTTTVFKCADGGNLTAYPINSLNSTLTSDSAVSVSSITEETAQFALPAMVNDTVTPVKVILRAWIEGQNSNAVSANAGTAFSFKFEIDQVED